MVIVDTLKTKYRLANPFTDEAGAYYIYKQLH